MTNCAVCPASQCMNRRALGLPPLPSSNSDSQSSTSGSSNNSGLIGGLVGGLVGLGILIGIGIYFYIRRAKKKRKLPFAFTDGGMGIMSQEKFQPPPTMASTLAQHNRSVVSTSEPTSRYIGLSELSSPTSPTSTIPSSTGQQNRSIVHPVSPTSNNNNNHDNNVYNNKQSSPNDNNNDSLLVPPNKSSTTLSNFADNSSIMASPIMGNSLIPPVIPEEFEEKIAIQNKRISQILHNNPRISRTSYTPQTQPESRFSGMSYTTDEDSEFDDDDKSIASSVTRQAVAQTRSPYQPQLATQAVQVTRAKAQIMRVNSVRTNNGGSGLGRSDSVRTILTSVSPPPTLPHLESNDSSVADSFPSTPNNRSFPNEDPFLDTTSNTISQ